MLGYIVKTYNEKELYNEKTGFILEASMPSMPLEQLMLFLGQAHRTLTFLRV